MEKDMSVRTHAEALTGRASLIRRRYLWLFPAILVCTQRLSVAEESTVSKANEGDSAAWRRKAVECARILSQVKWTPVADGMPNRRGGHFEKGKEYTGVPYSSVKCAGRYIGLEVFLKTFLAAVSISS